MYFTSQTKIKIQDPIAEGVLAVLGVGSGCKHLHTFLKGNKEYEVEVAFGQATDTYDSEGKVTKFGSIDNLSAHKVEDALEAFKGNVWQVPPIYSALNMDGRRLYDYARKGVSLPRPIKAREVEIRSIELTGFDDGKCMLRVGCGGGTYMRSLVNDLGIALGCYAHMTGLKRTRQGQWTWEDALSIEEGVLDLDAVRSILRSPTHT
ncbi:tRNA pseudouridine synthase B [Phycomyces blakesleeanus]|uniref:tRNA pseudouridine(55) synthase n=1 Tax=Phycomyces blakesleeanus TaxID=4837 RepID=A0ABR3BDM1_PHYBL